MGLGPVVIDFSKLARTASSEVVIEPRKVFATLPKKDPQFRFLHDLQAHVLDQWFERRQEKDVVVKMNTGSGKTLVALLALQSSLNENVSPAVYIAPDTFLAQQVLEEAQALGIPATLDENNGDFRAGRSILVANVHKLFNGLSVFGVGDQGRRISIGSIVIDDAHACLATIRDQFTVRISSGSEAYASLFRIVRPALRQQSLTKLLDVEAEDPHATMLIPFWSWQENQEAISNILHSHRVTDQLKFTWPLIGSVLEDCRCAIGRGQMEIAPICLPIDLIPSFHQAIRRIHTTATLADDSVLVTEFAADPVSVSKPITPTSAGDIGDRMILAPQEISPSITDDEMKRFLRSLANNHNVVVIVPSKNRSKFWSDVTDQTLMSIEIQEGIAKLKNGEHIGLTVLVNRYDGIDLPGKACRVLVIDGTPQVSSLLDSIDAIALHGTNVQISRETHKIEQGMGRAIRSNDDYCAVFLMGPHLAARMHDPVVRNQFTPGTLAQLNLSREVAVQLKGKSLQELGDAVGLCLDQDEEWVSESKMAVVATEYAKNVELNSLALCQRNAFDLVRAQQYRRAKESVQESVNKCQDNKVKGWLMSQMAQITNRESPTEAQQILLSALELNPSITRPMDGVVYSRLTPSNTSQAVASSKYFAERYLEGNELLIAANSVIDDIVFAPETANRFEDAMRTVGEMLGFGSQRPEAQFGIGPDNLWAIGEYVYLVIECKNGAVNNSISKRDSNQLSGSMNWFGDKYDRPCRAYPIIIHPSRTFIKEAFPVPDTRIIDKGKLGDFARMLRKFAVALAADKSFLDAQEVGKLLKHFEFTAKKFTNRYTVKFKKAK